ncbi:hypothetical protein ACS0TY_035719 [Phlomoides rotata]
MSKGKQTLDLDLAEEEVLRVVLDPEEELEISSRCIVGKSYGSGRGIHGSGNRQNLFSFQFNSEMDLRTVLDREPWHFDKNVLVLKELGRGQQPADVSFNSAAFWVRIYELPMAARNQRILTLIFEKIGELVEIDTRSMEGFGRSIRAKIKIDLHKPLKGGIHMALQENKKIWIEFKYERLPSFCYICGLLGHLRRECDLVNGSEGLEDLPETKLPFGEWMRTSPIKKAAVCMEGNRRPVEQSSMH